MSQYTKNYELIDSPQALHAFVTKYPSPPWMCLDTEFIGEKRYKTLLCLIQVVIPEGAFLFDPLKLTNLKPLLNYIENPAILKITHAGDNDYRLLNELFNIIPRNIFDAQIAAGFIGYRYPVSFGKLVQDELGLKLDKGYGVTDWDTRPFQTKQLSYALDDVLPLYDLWQQLRRKLEERGRLHWVEQEFQRMEEPEFYERDPNREALQSTMMSALSKRERVFLLRLYAWRRMVAEEKDYSKEMVLPKKHIGHIVRSIRSGKDALLKNRRVPDTLVKRYGSIFEEMYKQEITAAEQEMLKQIPEEGDIEPEKELLLEMLRMLIEYKCLKEEVSADLALPRSILKKMKAEEDYFDPLLKGGWREEFLGKQFMEWLEHRNHLQLEMVDGKVEFKLKQNR